MTLDISSVSIKYTARWNLCSKGSCKKLRILRIFVALKSERGPQKEKQEVLRVCRMTCNANMIYTALLTWCKMPVNVNLEEVGFSFVQYWIKEKMWKAGLFLPGNKEGLLIDNQQNKQYKRSSIERLFHKSEISLVWSCSVVFSTIYVFKLHTFSFPRPCTKTNWVNKCCRHVLAG